MNNQRSIWHWNLGIVNSLAICGLIVFFDNCTIAQITPDGTLPTNSGVTSSGNTSIIEGGTQAGGNLFHSFEQFSVPTGGEVLFKNDLQIQNIISRVTGSSGSSIDGLIKTQGTANLFLLNPKGIIFGSNASLEIGGSFLASTGSSFTFADDNQFSATNPQISPVLTVNVPTGLQFGTKPERIINRSQFSPDGALNQSRLPVGLQVQIGKTLALVGGDVLFEGGNLTAKGGRIELGSVAGNSLISLNPIEKGWALSYEGVENFQNIQLTTRTLNGDKISSFVDASGKSGGEFQLQGRLIEITDSSLIAATTGGLQPGNLTITASDSIELIGNSILSTSADSSGDAGDITINTRQFIVRDGAQVFTSTASTGSGGKLTVNALDSLKVIGSSPLLLSNGEVSEAFSGLSTATAAEGDAGELIINTRRLLIQDGGRVSTESARRIDPISEQIILATGLGGKLTVNASDSLELSGTSPKNRPSILFSSTLGRGNAGDINITTGRLTIQDGAVVTVSSEGTGRAGDLEITADSIRLNDSGKLIATSASGNGGNIRLQNLDLLLLRGKSEISTSAGGDGNGGDITINTDILTALENSDITANAFQGPGGNIKIMVQGLFLSPDSNITASSELGVDGGVEINRPEIDPSSGLVTLPTELVDISRLIAQGCSAGGGNVAGGASKFVATGHGGLPPTPTEALRSDAVLADLGTPVQGRENQASAASSNPTNSQPTPLVEAQGWVVGPQGEVVLIAQAPTITPHTPWLTPTTCNGS